MPFIIQDYRIPQKCNQLVEQLDRQKDHMPFSNNVFPGRSIGCPTLPPQVGSRTGARTQRSRFQLPPRQTQHADFPHYAFSINFA